MMQRALFLVILYLCLFSSFSYSQQSYSSSLINTKIDKLSTLGTVLYFAAHPDDENTRLIAWLANEKKYRTAYLSLTRGDGGQNLLGTEQGIELGLIRTQELLAARSIDKGEQYFSSAYDFGFSKTHEETFSFWKKEETLREAVYLIRKLQPDVIINRFPPDSRGGHGHHQASAILAKEAYEAAADPNKFPEQLKELKPWKAKRLLWNTANFGGMNNTNEDQLKIDIGAYNPLLGYSYGEIAALSRSQHKSQGFGAAAGRGKSLEYFEHVAGETAKATLFDGIDVSWKRLGESTAAIEQKISRIQQSFQASSPESSVDPLLELHALISKLKPSIYKTQKLKDIEELVIACSGLWIESTASKYNYVVEESVPISNELIVRNPKLNVLIKEINGKSINQELSWNEIKKYEGQQQFSRWTQPYWLEKQHSLGKFEVDAKDYGNPENANLPSSHYVLVINGTTISVDRLIKYKYVDPVEGEIYEPISISPVITATFSNPNMLIQANEKKQFTVVLKNNSPQKQQIEFSFKQSDDLNLSPSNFSLSFEGNEEIKKTIEISNTKQIPSATIELLANGNPVSAYKRLEYPHIPPITWFPPTVLKVKALSLNNPVKRVAYIEGAGDLIPSSLENIGIQVDVLSESQISTAILNNYDAAILGVRTYNVSKSIDRWFPALLAYVEQGGTVLVQYNVNSRMGLEKLGPYPFQISRARVTEEDAKVKFIDPKDPSLNYPNKITSEDFNGWIQERGLYFTEDIDGHYRTPLSFADKNEKQHNGSLLLTKYGKGKFVYTSLAFFRQLPAGVPGAYRLFVNLLAKEEL
ncbi:LmbE family protein [Sphingobacterium sp. DK4209]|uniref:LmbE family protein n=1 Tax=Sphingobacterium zhuxiongii TaxID=2662364 RepID=A0A5Q0QEW0_9SPHI|nr:MULTISPECIES: PIG-L family deacetylase [unclassified Sphingobacterium]MVZ65893.1 LmbE family protein [Sphingobacterium sp. DK4209]QGA28093.1 LmbE family protein [Sphingobacterium sp. dk4302]